MPRDGAWDKEMRGKKALKSPMVVERWFVVVFAVSSSKGLRNNLPGGRLEEREEAADTQRFLLISQQHDSPGREGFARRQVQMSVNQFLGACKDFGITFTLTEPMIVYVGSTSDVKAAIKDAAKRAGYGRHAPPQFVLAYVSVPLLGATSNAC